MKDVDEIRQRKREAAVAWARAMPPLLRDLTEATAHFVNVTEPGAEAYYGTPENFARVVKDAEERMARVKAAFENTGAEGAD